MFGRNPKRPPVAGDGTLLEVQDIFPTFQGEGPLAGRAAVFIRLGGCNLSCSFCDTEFESYDRRPLSAILGRARTLSAAMTNPLAVITGGEPLRQPIGPLCEALLDDGFAVQIETNGTLWRPIDERVHVICSPKAGSSGYGPLRGDIAGRADALKFIISATQTPYIDVPALGQPASTPVYVQPMDTLDPATNARNLAYTIRLAHQHGYLLSLQLHKYIGVA